MTSSKRTRTDPDARKGPTTPGQADDPRALSSRLAAIVRSSHDAIIGETLDGVITSWNAAAERLFGYSAREAVGRPMAMLCPPDHADEWRRNIDSVRKGTPVSRVETTRLAKDGREVHVSITLSPVTDAGGRLVGASAILHDVTDRKRAEGALRESEARFRATFEQAAVGIAHVRPDGRWLRVNEKLCEIVGYSRDELLRKTFQEITHPDDVAPDVAQTERLLAGEIANYTIEKRYVRKDGSAVWVSLTGSLVRDAAGAPDYCVAVVKDVTARREAEARLRESEQRIRAIVETATDAIVTVGPDGRVLSFNPAAERMFGYAAGEAVGREVRLLVAPPEGGDFGRDRPWPNGTGVRPDTGRVFELLGRRRTGETFPVELTVGEVAEGRLFTGIIRDVSDQKTLQEQVLAVAEQEQRRIGQDLHDDIGQEITGLRLTAETLAESLEEAASPDAKLAARLVEALGRTHRKVRVLSQGLVPLEIDSGGLPSALAELTARVQGFGGVRCSFETAAGVSACEGRVATQLYRIAQEAVSNAVRHARASHIRVSLGSDGDIVTLRVRDDGAGFGPDAARQGSGLRIMRYRASLIRATLTVGAAGGGGTEMTCRVECRGRVEVP